MSHFSKKNSTHIDATVATPWENHGRRAAETAVLSGQRVSYRLSTQCAAAGVVEK
jgi:hypothetical protein